MRVIDGVRNGENIFLTGDPGTGKTTVINEMVKACKEDGKRVTLTASTGIAAEQLDGGCTLHHILKAHPKMDFNDVDFEKKIVYLENTDVLIVDEISMVGSKLFTYLGECIENVSHPIQVVFVGDFFQLPPVKDSYAFNSPFWNSFNLKAYFLKEIMRQGDKEFIENINLLKRGDKSCIDYLLSNSSPVEHGGQISICARKDEVKAINDERIRDLLGPQLQFSANYDGKISESNTRLETSLVLKKGMRVMSLVNGTGYSNGSIGTITDLDHESVEVAFDNGTVTVFKKQRFKVDRADVPGETTDFWQIPLRPAYAITIHKSQGQTFDFVNIDGRKCWAPGQLYVAVSRARSIGGIHFLKPIIEKNIQTDKSVVDFSNQIRKG